MADLLVNIDVDDLEKAVAFYVDALGLRPGRRLGSTVVELLGASTPIYLLEKPPGSPAFPAAAGRRDYARHWTPVHLDFAVGDLDTALAHALRAGATREGDVQRFVWGRMATLADPFGHGLCLLQFEGRGYDEIAG